MPLDPAAASAARALAGHERLLVASDFDGTLAPIAQHPEDVVADAAAVAALNGLSLLGRTHVAIVSGRPGASLRELLPRLDPGVRLMGSHGTEMDVEPTAREIELRERLTRVLDEVAASFPGALVERKPLGVAFHVRRVDPALQSEALEIAERSLDLPSGTRLLRGRKIIEAILREGDKGTALARLRATLEATATVFLGDDLTDEDAFAVLSSPPDVGLKIGSAPSRASHRLPDRADVAPFLERLLAERTRDRP